MQSYATNLHEFRELGHTKIKTATRKALYASLNLYFKKTKKTQLLRQLAI